MRKIALNITNEFDPLSHVVVGTGTGYHRDRARVEVVNETQQRAFNAGAYPSEQTLLGEFAAFKAVLKENNIHVYEPRLAPVTVQDQTCPRDIGFVIGDVLVIAAMRNHSRAEEFAGIRHLLEYWHGHVIEAPDDAFLEGGDVIIDDQHIFVGYGQRSDRAGVEFMQDVFGQAYEIVPMACRSVAQGENILHLDCTFNPLGLGHVLIYKNGLLNVPPIVTEKYIEIPVDRIEAEALATNVFSIRPDTVIARSAPQCARVNAVLKDLGYRVIEVDFDLVPSTGGSFRCVTMPVHRIAATGQSAA